jgi:hypothetical protein
VSTANAELTLIALLYIDRIEAEINEPFPVRITQMLGMRRVLKK